MCREGYLCKSRTQKNPHVDLLMHEPSISGISRKQLIMVDAFGEKKWKIKEKAGLEEGDYIFARYVSKRMSSF